LGDKLIEQIVAAVGGLSTLLNSEMGIAQPVDHLGCRPKL